MKMSSVVRTVERMSSVLVEPPVSVVSDRLTPKERKTKMKTLEQVSKNFLEDWSFCRWCDEDTWHVVGENGLECEYCLLSVD